MNEIEKKLPSIIEDKDLSALADSIADMVNEAKSHLVQTECRKLRYSSFVHLL